MVIAVVVRDKQCVQAAVLSALPQHFLTLACSNYSRSLPLSATSAVDLVIKALRKLPWLNEAEVKRLSYHDLLYHAPP